MGIIYVGMDPNGSSSAWHVVFVVRPLESTTLVQWVHRFVVLSAHLWLLDKGFGISYMVSQLFGLLFVEQEFHFFPLFTTSPTFIIVLHKLIHLSWPVAFFYFIVSDIPSHYLF